MEELWWMQRKHKFHFHRFLFSFFIYLLEEHKKMDTSQLYSAMGDPNQSSSSSGRRRRRSIEIETTSLEIRKCPRDLFHSFPPTDRITTQNGLNHPPKSAIEEQEEDGEIELNLGLSLGGRFGVDKSQRGLVRASSIAWTTPTFREMEESPGKVAALARTSSLPTEEEWRRRKEIQTLRRMEARRRRSEKQRSMKENNSICGEERGNGSGLNVKGKLERQLSGQPEPGFNPGKLNPGSGSGKWVVAGGVKGKGGFFGSLQGLLTHQQQQQQQQQQQGNSQGSAESQGGCSSVVSELESTTHPGSSSCGETRSPANTHTTQERGSQDPPLGSNKRPETSDYKKKEAPTSGIEDMPCVFTIGDGPNGRKVEGILYKYGKREEVRIMCVCHGSFLSPAEFVKHAGGCDVEQPLKHILVNPSPSPY